MTDPEQAAEFVARTGIDVLAISFGNAHGVYHTKPNIDLARAREIAGRVEVPLAMHGASGLEDGVYAEVIASGVSKICYYTTMGRQISVALRDFTAQADLDTLNYHQIISVAMDEFCRRAKDLLTLLGSAGKAQDVKPVM